MGGWQKVQRLFSYKGLLWAMDQGTLYRADRDAKWTQVGAVGEWGNARILIPAH